MAPLNAELRRHPHDDPPGKMPGSTASGTPAAALNRYCELMKLTLAHDHKLPTGLLGLAITPDGNRAFAG